jgi:signal transduction histidine kinase
VPVTGTRWDAVDLHEPGLFATYHKELYIEALIVFVAFGMAAIFMIRRLRREELQRELAERQRQELMGVISHEFRTPASAIHGALELINRGTAGPVNAETQKLVDLAESNTTQLLTLVNDFLDLQKYEAGKLTMHMVACELRPIIDTAIKNNQTYARQFGVTFLLNDSNTDIKLLCDARRIEQVLANLLSNAAKYGAKNDVIEISVTRPSKATVRISVTDHGEGVASHIQDKIFQKFVMARGVKRGKVRSSGLGLSISRAIIDEHGGSIDFESRPGEGATFYFELPVKGNE